MTVKGVPIDLGLIETPAYIQAGREDHIAPAPSVWKLTRVLKGPQRFILAGSGHIAGVVNPPAAITRFENGRLADVAPTLLALLGLKQPEAMTGRPLIAAESRRSAAE